MVIAMGCAHIVVKPYPVTGHAAWERGGEDRGGRVVVVADLGEAAAAPGPACGQMMVRQ